MPGPIRGNTSAPIVPPVLDEPAAPAAPPAEAPATEAGWGPKARGLADKATVAVKDAVVKEASKERSLGLSQSATLGGVGLTFGGKVSEKVALRANDALVAGDPRRAAAAAGGDTVWTKLSVATNVGASAGSALTGGASASLGFAAGAEVTAIVPADKSLSFKNLGATLKEQGQTLALALDASSLLADNPAPGTELMVRGYASSSASVGAGGSAQAGIARASVGVGLSASHSEEFTKNVKVLGDGLVYAQVAKVDSNAQGLSASLQAGIDAPGSSAGGLSAKVVDAAAKQVEQRVKLGGSIGVSTGQSESLRVGGVFDLKTPGGRQAFEYLMKADPLSLQASPEQAQTTLRNMGMGAAYADRTSTAGVSANLQLGKTELLNFSSARRTTEGVLLEKKSPDGTTEQTRLSEAEYTRHVGGVLPRVMVGEERSVSVRAGSVSRDGVETRAAIASITIKDPKVSAGEQQQLASFATQVGSTLPPTTQAGGKGTFAVQVALTDENLKKLDGRSADDLKTAFSFAKGSLEGGVAPWMDGTLAKVNTHYRYAPQQTVKQEFADGERALDRARQDDPGARDSAIRDYKATTGRDLVADVGSHEAMNQIVAELVKARGKPVSEWGPALSALGRQSSVDVRTALVALTRLADASMVSLDITANGASLSAKQAEAPKSAAQLVGPILTPAGVN